IYQLKGIAQGLCLSLNHNCSFNEVKPFSEIFSTSHFSTISVDSEEIGFISYLEPQKLKEYEIIGKVCVLEISLNKLLKMKDPSFKQFSRYPASRRDLSILVDSKVKWAKIEESLMNVGANCLNKIELKEVYQDEKLGKDKKSITLTLIFQSHEKTLSESDIESDLTKIIDKLKYDFNAVLR
ncbi:MAG: hypothetical protein N2445_05865, partial [Acidobacteria bacterium]|nr:hypothetical protein [Acidobacteriota bacterium]